MIHCSIVTCVLVSQLRNPIQGCEDVCLCFPLQALSLTHIAVSHFKISFMYGEKEGSNFILLFMDIQLLHHHLFKRFFFLSWIVFVNLLKISCLYMFESDFWTYYSVFVNFFAMTHPWLHSSIIVMLILQFYSFSKSF